VKSTIGCSAGSGTTVTKLGTFNGPGDVELGELRFGITNQSFPSRYSVAVTVADLLDPSSAGGVSCAGFAVHTNADGSTFEEVVVCGDGAFSIIRWLNNAEVYRNDHAISRSNSYLLKADVTDSTITYTIDNSQGGVDTIAASTPLTSTSYIGL